MSEVIEEIDEADELAPLHAQIAAALPASWTLETLGSLCEKSQYGWTTKADKAGSGVKFLRTTDITPGVVDWSSVPYCVEAPSDLEKYLIKDGDILISRTGSIGVNYLVVKPEPAVFASYLIRFRPKTSISTKYLKYYLQSPAYWQAINTGKKGIAVQNVNATMLSRIPIPVAPPAVQDEIVAELEKQFSRLDEAVANLQRVKANLKRYKASVLKAAVEGRLVETEASLARREGRTYETGEQLLQRILEERRAKWAGKGKYPKPDVSALTELPMLPDGWTWSAFGFLGADPHNTVQTGPFGAQLHNTDFVPSGVPVIAVGNLTGTGFKREGLYFIKPEKAAQLSRYDIWSGDILFARSGATLGKVCVAPADVSDWRMTGHILRARLNRRFLNPDIAVYALSSLPAVTKQIFGSVRGVTRPGFNTSLLESVWVPVPPIAEQARIIAEVDRHLSIIREVEAEVDANLQRAQALRQAVLATSFK